MKTIAVLVQLFMFTLYSGFIMGQDARSVQKGPPGKPPVIQKIKDIVIYTDSNFHSAFPSVIKRSNGDLVVAFRRAPNRSIFGEKKTNHVDPTSQLMMVIHPIRGIRGRSQSCYMLTPLAVRRIPVCCN